MKKRLFLLSISMLYFHAHPLETKDPTSFFNVLSSPLGSERVATSPYALLKAARYAKTYYFKSNLSKEKLLTRSTIFEKNTLSHRQAQETLDFIIKTILEDHAHKKKKFRINDPLFLKEHFSFIKWSGDQEAAKKNRVFISDDKIRLTHYAVFSCRGSYEKSNKHPHALYDIMGENFQDRQRTKYSKQDILDGLLEQSRFSTKVKPLIWLSRYDFEQALMQGSIIVKTPDNKKMLFNVSKSNVSDKNNFAYDRKIKNSWNQKLYWYFKEIKYDTCLHDRRHRELVSLGGAVFAGDIESLGLGKIIALRYENRKTGKTEVKLGVLADRGSAFSNNLYQLDLFEGIFDTRKQFDTYIRRYPDTVEAYILKKRKKRKYHAQKDVTGGNSLINSTVRELRPNNRKNQPEGNYEKVSRRIS